MVRRAPSTAAFASGRLWLSGYSAAPRTDRRLRAGRLGRGQLGGREERHCGARLRERSAGAAAATNAIGFSALDGREAELVGGGLALFPGAAGLERHRAGVYPGVAGQHAGVRHAPGGERGYRNRPDRPQRDRAAGEQWAFAEYFAEAFGCPETGTTSSSDARGAGVRTRRSLRHGRLFGSRCRSCSTAWTSSWRSPASSERRAAAGRPVRRCGEAA
jgi:hypothetical protein